MSRKELMTPLGKAWTWWVFVDYICLPQYHRTKQEQHFFKRAMRAMHVLYSHKAVRYVVRLEELTQQMEGVPPPASIDIYYEESTEPGKGKFGPQPFSKLDFNNTPYHCRGWCVAECQWMSSKTVAARGIAPMTPERFRQRVELARQNMPGGLPLVFTHRADEEAVLHLQEEVFLKQARRHQQLVVRELPLQEQLFLAEALPHFTEVTLVVFVGCVIEEEAAVALAAALAYLKNLKMLGILHSVLSDSAAEALARGLRQRNSEKLTVFFQTWDYPQIQCQQTEPDERAKWFEAVEGIEVSVICWNHDF
ncbi:LZTR1 [Symbiodinium sp. CCMP2456]|nr:LZTR1 [Symbiodinium sp. CCMP2456]